MAGAGYVAAVTSPPAVGWPTELPAAAEASNDQVAHFPVRWGPHVVRVAFSRIVMLAGYADPAETVVACPDQDVVCDVGYCALDTEPIIFQCSRFRRPLVGLLPA